ncbi:hypothetical protein BDR04DRAFT_1137709 [Suillus decipiens]|nr:hypothetical protein BDR04DRAFT_1137709 [Suillus decipiens]
MNDYFADNSPFSDPGACYGDISIYYCVHSTGAFHAPLYEVADVLCVHFVRASRTEARCEVIVQTSVLKALDHPRCVGWGEICLDYHYDNSPRAVQQEVLNHAVRLGKPLTIHTREAEADTERILMEHVPAHHKTRQNSHSDDFSTSGLSHSTNLNTPNIVSQMAMSDSGPRILLETDAPFMAPSSL